MKYKNKNTIEPWPESRSVYGWDTPIKKLPNCPNCDEDELSMLNSDQIFCNACNIYYEPKEQFNAIQQET